ncbi:proline-rich transmembrane protein 3-like [Nerophis ophidion]|uniref:proline-rich transmembrane protein 3-like n=1 Tax=Nerophis ophidion TaxID=159077 RepID=UPI002AE03EEA|nr:proline-rich transmembrane protein 3-like [Nerophis ophidion]XP_061731586.1 proline-rich transmembrane protein 3-like [Nerophis ophidion]
MGCPSLLLITLTACLPSLGSLSDSHSWTETTIRRVSETERSSVGSRENLLDGTIRPLAKEQARNPDELTLTGSAAITTPRLIRPGASGAADANSSVAIHSRLGVKSLDRRRKTASVDNRSLTDEDHPVQTRVLSSATKDNLSRYGRPCIQSPCVRFTNYNGTNLQWDDMRRTLAFAWEIHVFGSASLFILMASLAVMGLVGASTLPYPHCGTLMLANSALIMGGAVRAVHLLLDPYGTRQIVSHATLAALQNVPMQLLPWAQVTLTLVTPRRFKLFLFPMMLQKPQVVAGLLVSHCTVLLAADLHFTDLLPLLPLFLQTLSLCWGLPFCMEILTKSLSHLNIFYRSSLPLGVSTQRIEMCAKRVTAVCASLGIVCCSLQICSLLWLYGLMGNWRRFGWGWWLGQFWARILELAWGFSLLVLGSWIFWMPSRRRGQREVSKTTSWWDRVLASVQQGRLKRSEKKWRALMPNNLAKHHLSGSSFITSPYENQPSVVVTEYKCDPSGISNGDSQAAFLQKVSERECILSFINLDTMSPSPVNPRRSMDNALHHGQLLAGSLFTPPPPSWTHSNDENGTTAFPPAYVGYGWMIDTESIPASLDHFQAREPSQITDHSCNDQSKKTHREEEFSSRLSTPSHSNDWSDEDVTNF